jgi:RimJ/RimL family protein N-acetyltransferase
MEDLKFVLYDKVFLDKSWFWLNDPEIKQLTITPDFTRESQIKWFNSLKDKNDYYIFGVQYQNKPIGVCGLKNIQENTGEYWGYIGEKEYWGRKLGGKMLEYILNLASNKNINEMVLKVWQNNIRAIKLYENYGFKEANKLNEILTMTKELAS